MSDSSNTPGGKKPLIDIIDYSFGQQIIREGEAGDRAFIIKQGEVEVIKRNLEGTEVFIARLGPQEMFGEMCLFEDNAPRSATVRAVTDNVRVMAISKEHLQETIDQLPDGMRTLFKILIQRLRDASRHIAYLS